VALLQDITERKRAEETLHRDALVLANVSDSVITTDLEGTITFWNEGATRLFGWTAAEMMGRPYADRFPEPERSWIAEQIRSRAAGTGWVGEYLDRRKDGSRLWIDAHVRLFTDTAGRPHGIIGIARDITERKLTEESLRESESRLAEAQQIAHIGSWSWDLASDEIVWSDEHYRIVGLRPQAVPMTAERAANYIHPDDREAAWGAVRRATRDRQPYEWRLRMVREDGTIIIAQSRGQSVCDEAGRPVRMFGTVQDVTERTRAEEEVRRARDELDLRVRERTAALSDALAALGRQEEVRKELLRRVVTVQEDERRRISRELHDQMGQQLTALMLRLRLARDSAGEDSPLREQLRWLEDHAARISRDVHRVALELRPTALDDLGLPEALSQYADEWTRRSGVAAELRVHGLGEGRLPSLAETTIYRAVQEAMTNVLKHAGATRVVVTLSRLKDSVSVIIEDDGRGFEGEGAMESDSRARLGLLGMKERVAFAGGTLAIESSPGAGTSVLIRIPARSSEEGPR
ncbi:MAG: PAS domain S-box protein, partial [Acetobacteraceae bacterium]|nr:PAS domain S-box protein [Acetobacteraceae bacterium]